MEYRAASGIECLFAKPGGEQVVSVLLAPPWSSSASGTSSVGRESLLSPPRLRLAVHATCVLPCMRHACCTCLPCAQVLPRLVSVVSYPLAIVCELPCVIKEMPLRCHAAKMRDSRGRMTQV